MTKSFVLRSVEKNDQAFLDALYFSTREDLQFPGADPDFVLRLIKMQQQAQLNGFEQLYPEAKHWLIEKTIISETGQSDVLPVFLPVGRAVVNHSEHEMRLVDIAVMPQHRRSGVGRWVLLDLQQQASARQLALSLAVSKNNHAARQLYLALGFEPTSADELFEQMLWRPI